MRWTIKDKREIFSEIMPHLTALQSCVSKVKTALSIFRHSRREHVRVRSLTMKWLKSERRPIAMRDSLRENYN